MTSYKETNESKSNMIDGKNSVNIQNKKCLNYALFLESLAISAMTFKSNENFSDIEKVWFLFYFIRFCIWLKEWINPRGLLVLNPDVEILSNLYF